MAWPSAVLAGTQILAAQINSIIAGLATWAGAVNGNGNALSNVGSLQVAGAATFTAPDQIALGAGWTAWTPVLTPSGAMTLTSYSIVSAKYLRVGPMVFLQVVVGYTLGGTLGNSLVLTGVPFPLVDSGNGITCWNISSTSALSAQFTTNVSITLQNSNATSFLGGAQFLTLGGFYHC